MIKRKSINLELIEKVRTFLECYKALKDIDLNYIIEVIKEYEIEEIETNE